MLSICGALMWRDRYLEGEQQNPSPYVHAWERESHDRPENAKPDDNFRTRLWHAR
jgi:hypothetical protein